MSGKTAKLAWKVMLCGLAGFGLAIPAAAQEHTAITNPDGTLKIFSTISAIREVPAGKPMAGLHIDVKVDGRTLDVYLAPMSFVSTYDVKLVKGDEVRIIGSRSKEAGAEVVLAREISTGTFVGRTGAFRANMTVYLRNDDGPLWNDDTKPAPKAIPAF